MNNNIKIFINEYRIILNESVQKFNELSDEETDIFISNKDFIFPLNEKNITLQNYLKELNNQNISTIYIDENKFNNIENIDYNLFEKMIALLKNMFNKTDIPEHKYYFVDNIIDLYCGFYPDLKGLKYIKNKIKNIRNNEIQDSLSLTNEDYFVYKVMEDAISKYISLCEIKKLRKQLLRMINNYNVN